MKLSVTIATVVVAGLVSASPLHSNEKRSLVIEDEYEAPTIVTVTVNEAAQPTPWAPPPPPPPAPAVAPPPKDVHPSIVVNAKNVAGEAGGVANDMRLNVVMTPFKGDPDHTACKDPDEIIKEVDYLVERGVGGVRYHGTSCNQVCSAYKAKKKYPHLRLMLGIFRLSEAKTALPDFFRQVDECGGNINDVNTFGAGSEDVHNGESPSAVRENINWVATQLRSRGFNGRIVHSEPDYVYRDHPELCRNDYGISRLGVNIFPYFDPTVRPEHAGSKVARIVDDMRQCWARNSGGAGENSVMVTEFGYPTAATPNGEAVAGDEQQREAVSDTLSKVDAPIYLFTAFDHTWQRNFPGSFGAETNYGLFRKRTRWSPVFNNIRMNWRSRGRFHG